MTDRQASSKGRLCASAALLLLSLLSCSSDPVASRAEFLGRGQQYLEVERYQEAAIELQNALQITPTHVPALFALAQAYSQLGEHQRAHTLLGQIRELDDSHVEVRLELAKYLLGAASDQEDYYGQVLELAEEILALDPTHIEARILRGNAHAGLGDVEQSLAQLDEVLEQDPDNLTAYINRGVFRQQLRDPENAEKSFLEAARRHPGSGLALRSLANFYTARGDQKQAETYYRKALEVESDDNANLHALVRFYLTTRNHEKAEETLKEIIGSSDNTGEADWLLANFYLATGRTEAGLEQLRSLSEKNPSDPRPALRLADALLNLNRTDEARTIIESLPGERANAQALYLRGRLLLAGDKQEDALETFTKATELQPRFIPAHMRKASLHLTRGEFSQARQSLTMVLMINRGHLGAAAALAKILALTGRSQDALSAAAEILEVYPASVDALMARAEALFRLRRFDESGRDYLKLVELRPQVAFYRQRLGTLEASRGNQAAALEHLSKTLRLIPTGRSSWTRSFIYWPSQADSMRL